MDEKGQLDTQSDQDVDVPNQSTSENEDQNITDELKKTIEELTQEVKRRKSLRKL